MTYFFRKCGRDVKMMTSSTQNKLSKKILVNTNPHAKLNVSMAFGLGIKCVGQITRVK